MKCVVVENARIPRNGLASGVWCGSAANDSVRLHCGVLVN